jgi:Uma2 family endonuclease
MLLSRPTVTCREFERIAPFLGPSELIDGNIQELPFGDPEYGMVCVTIGSILGEFCKRTGSGRAFGNSAGIHIRADPPRTRGMDVAYISYKRLPRGPLPKGFFTMPPELVVEVLGESRTWEDLQEKIKDYHSIGVDMVWIADPHTRTVKTYPLKGESKVIHDGSEIDGGKLLPGFHVPIAEFFEEP